MTDEASVKLFVDAFFREKWRDIIVVLTRRFGPQHLDEIENAVQTAMVRALDTWPLAGIPDNPGGWIFTVARNQMLDRLRKAKLAADNVPAVTDSLYANDGALPDWAGPLEDDTLRMILVCCHPRLAARESIAITLRLICGLGTRDIAGALLIGDEATRKLLYRTKDKIRQRRFPFELPEPDEQADRLDRVLQIVYLLFNEGYAAHTGEALTRNELCAEAQRLSDLLLRSQMAQEGRVWALAALMALQASRLPARVDANGRLLRLQEQDRSCWDRRQIALGFDLLNRSMASPERSRYHLEAAIAACHAAAESYERTDWDRIRGFYDDLMVVAPSPVVELNRSVAVMMTEGPAAGLAVLQSLEDAPALKDSYLLPALQGDFEVRAGRPDLAERHYRAALEKSENSPVRDFWPIRSALAPSADCRAIFLSHPESSVRHVCEGRIRGHVTPAKGARHMANTKIAINWFEIPVEDLDRAATFYSAVFETDLIPMETPGGTIMAFQNDEAPVGALSPCDGNAPSSNGAMLYFDADGDIDGTLKRVEAAGGKVILPNTAIGPYGYMAHFADTEGNRVALHSM